jgi:peptidoglycan/LPS O-acetylase OafA/YrhL
VRFEVLAAQVLGVGLPVLEVLRRRTHVDTLAGYLDDFIAGALLLFAARAARKGSPSGPALLAAAWGVVSGGAYYSFFGQLENAAPRDVSGLPNGVVVLIKGLLFAIALASLALSVRHARCADGATPHSDP